MEDQPKQDSPRVLKVMEALKQASQELQTPPESRLGRVQRVAINALLELETESDSHPLPRPTSLCSLPTPRHPQNPRRGLQPRVARFGLEVQSVHLLGSVLCDSNCSKRVREHCAFAIAALIKFNKDVLIKSPLVDEIEFHGQIPQIINLLNCEDNEMRVMAFVCVLEIGYFGRKEAIDAMLEEGLIEKLVELQRSDLGGDLMELGMYDEQDQNKSSSRDKKFLERRPFSSCVARFAVQLEVGEGLRQRERRAFKQQILVRVREASISDAEAATIIAEVLWGSSP
ncbi:hypothetical protein M0R45_003115 [Rubus argutus]|uniref:Uncharacterized protein n=1 Tax=Rubus argutus TaxID=59490 RepID=A0AAW1YHJ8_RUBAR